MIVDVHVHFGGHGWVRGKYLRFVWEAFVKRYNKIHGTNLTPGELGDLMREGYTDPDGEKLLKRLDGAGVDHAVVFGVDWSIMTGEPRVTQQEQNKAHAEAAKRHPDRFTALGALDPRRGNLMEMAKECIEDWGMRGFYIMSAAGFQYTDPICFPLYEKCIEWKVPVVLHCGTEVNHWAWQHPLAIADVVCKYPDLTVIMGHAGTGLWREEVIAVAKRPNAYIDFSGFQGLWELHPDRFYQWLRDACDECGADKIMWASGYPNTDLLYPEAEWVKAVKEPKTKIKFIEEEKEWILGKTAKTVYKIKG